MNALLVEKHQSTCECFIYLKRIESRVNALLTEKDEVKCKCFTYRKKLSALFYMKRIKQRMTAGIIPWIKLRVNVPLIERERNHPYMLRVPKGSHHTGYASYYATETELHYVPDSCKNIATSHSVAWS